MQYEETGIAPRITSYVTIVGSLFSVVGAIIYGTWTLQGFINNTDRRVVVLETNNMHITDKIGRLSSSLSRQEDKIDKIYLIMSNKGNKNANFD